MEDIKTISFEIPEVRLPTFYISEEDKIKYSISEDHDIDQILRQICLFNFNKKIKDGKIVNTDNVYGKRVKYELDILRKTKFAHYILIIWDAINFCKKSDIPVGPGRGSGAGSLVNYLIGITNVDPIKYGLIFERFISMSRAKMRVGEDGQTYYDGNLLPDIDCDICPKNRQKVYDYLNTKYKGKVSKVSTLATLQSKILAKNLCKIILEYSETEAMGVSKTIPVLYGKVFSFKKARENSGEFDKFCQEHPEIYKIGLKLTEAPINFGVHAAAVLISYEDIDKVVPCISLFNKKEKVFETVSEYHMYDALEHILKVDLLGLDTLTIVNEVCTQIGISPDDIPVEDYDQVYKYLENLTLPYGVFQFSGKAVLEANKKIRASSLSQGSDVTALSRPGASDYIDSYISKTEPTKDPGILKIIGETNNVTIYQEQLIRIAKDVFHLTEDEGDQIRRSTAKKKPEEIAKWEKVINEKSVEHNISDEAKNYYLKILQDSANYSFNKCLCPNSVVETTFGQKTLKEVKIGDYIKSFSVKDGKLIYKKVKDKIKSTALLYEVKLSNGNTIKCSLDHKFLSNDMKMHTLRDILKKDLDIMCMEYGEIMQFTKIQSIKKLEEAETLDLEIDSEDHNFICNGLVTSNSHSICYTVLTAQTVWCKFHHPLLFYIACLKFADTSNFLEIKREARHFGIEILGPDLYRSKFDFSIEENNIRIGLNNLKNIQEPSKILELKRFLGVNKFELFHTVNSLKIQNSTFKILIHAGMLNSVLKDRLLLSLEFSIWNELSLEEQQYCLTNGAKYNFNLIEMLKDFSNWTNKKGKPFKSTRINTIRKDCKNALDIYNINKRYNLLSSYIYEKHLLGFSYTTTLKQIYDNSKKHIMNIAEIIDEVENKEISTVIHVKKCFAKKSLKSNKDYIRIEGYDETGEYVFQLWAEKATEFLLKNKAPDEEDIVLLEGRKGVDIVWLDKITIQDEKIISQTRDLKKYIEKTNTEI